jgi:predicted RNase H-like HicB family nuclease
MPQPVFMFNLVCGYWRDDDAGVWVSQCPRLNLYSQGTTPEEAIQAIRDSVGLYTQVCYEHGLLNEVLQKAGFTHVEGEGTKRTASDLSHEFIAIGHHKAESFEISVPLYLVAQEQLQATACLH